MNKPEGFHYFINHLKQRLVIMLDHNIRNGIDPCDSDVVILRELYELYDKDVIDTFSDTEVVIKADQQRLF